MKRSLPKALLILVALSVILAACIPSPAAPTVAPTQVAATLPAVQTTADPAAAPPTVLPTLGPAECKAGLSAIQPPTAEQAAMVAKVPPVNANDLVRGPADASVTILEYSDYQ